MPMSRQEQQAAARNDHPMREVVDGFQQARESCRYYRGIKDSENSRQCTHDRNRGPGDWCAMDCCPLLRQRAEWVGIGWN
jgi:hypothetical protein